MRKWYPAFLVVLVVAASVVAYPRLPARVPVHWNGRGQIDGYGSKWVTLVLMPAMLIVLWGVLRFLPRIDPRRANYARMQGTYDIVVNLVLSLLAFMHLVILAITLGAPIDMARVAPAGIGILFIVLGNVLPRARPNWWFGIRTPWTLSDDRVWERTHRVGGYLFVAAGIVAVVAALLPHPATPAIAAIVAGAAALITVVYSYFAWRQETSQ